MKNYSTLFFFFLISSLFAQNKIQLSGIVTDAKDKGLDLAIVSLLNPTDSSFVQSEYTNEDGTFLLSNITEGNYLLQINLLGYTTYNEPIDVSGQTTMALPKIQLEEDVQLIEEAVVKAKIPFVERKIDRTVINPQALIANAGGNALEVLERAPGVAVDNGTISLKGRSGVAVFINDKPSYLSGTELENYLRALPAGSIKQIELMENPPAKYDAAGNSGVINIIIKRNTLKGFYGNTSLSYRKSRYNSSNNSLNLNYNKNKISLYANIYAGFYNGFQDLFINRYYRDEQNTPLSAFEQNSFNRRDGQYLNGKIGLDYYITDHTAIGFSYKNVQHPSGRNVDNIALVSDAIGTLEQRVVADNTSDLRFQNAIYNVYINHSIDSLGSKISFDADYVDYTTANDQLFKNFIYNELDELVFEDQVNGAIPASISIYAAKTDYTKPFKDGSRFEAGLKTARTQTDNEAIYSTTIEGITEPDYNLSNRFLYDEWINSAYVNYSRKLGKVDIQAGLRAEATNLTGDQLGNVEQAASSFTRNYNSLFPTFYAAMPLDTAGIHRLSFSFGRRIDRPYFADLNPFISPLDRFTFYSGNPDLLPTFSHNLSLTHSFKGFLNTELGFSKTVDGINETLEIIDQIYYSRPGNISSSTSLTLSVDGTFEVSKWYSINSYVELGYLQFDSELYTEQLNSSGTYTYLSLTNNFDLGKGWRANLGGRYRSDLVSAQLLIKSFWVMNMGVQKKLFDGKGSLRLGINDIFYSRRGDGIINNLRLTDADWNSTFDSRQATITFSYNFGKASTTKQRYKSSGSDSEQRRVRN